MATGIRRAADDLALEAIVVSPSFSNDDFNASRFPVLGEGAFLKGVLEELRREYRLRSKMLLTGYSLGGAFSHRFAFRNPELVEAAAPFAPAQWTTPDGRLLIDSLGEVESPESFLSSPRVLHPYRRDYGTWSVLASPRSRDYQPSLGPKRFHFW